MDVASAQIGISKPTLSRVEKGKTATVEVVAKIIGWLGYSPNRYFK